MAEVNWQYYNKRVEGKSNDWYWGFFITIFTIITISILSENYIFAIVMVMSGGLIVRILREPARLIVAKINNKGIFYNNKSHIYSEFESFGIDKTSVVPKLIVKKNKDQTFVIIPFVKEKENFIRNEVSRYLKEEDLKENWIAKVADMILY